LDADLFNTDTNLELGLQPVQQVSAVLFLNAAPDVSTGEPWPWS
jgi:hypothetical protein